MQEAASPRLVQFSHGCARLHFNFLCRHGAHERGTLFLFLITLNCSLGECAPALEDVDGGVGDIVFVKLGGDEGRRVDS